MSMMISVSTGEYRHNLPCESGTNAWFGTAPPVKFRVDTTGTVGRAVVDREEAGGGRAGDGEVGADRGDVGIADVDRGRDAGAEPDDLAAHAGVGVAIRRDGLERRAGARRRRVGEVDRRRLQLGRRVDRERPRDVAAGRVHGRGVGTGSEWVAGHHDDGVVGAQDRLGRAVGVLAVQHAGLRRDRTDRSGSRSPR